MVYAVTVVFALALILASRARADIQVCISGATAGKCTSPRGLAVDFETGLLYVADNGNNRIDVFKNEGKESGTPSSFGGITKPEWIAVDNATASPSHHDIYVTTASYTIKKFGPNGSLADEFGTQGDGTPEGCQLERANDPVAVGPNGDVYVADSYQTGAANNLTNRIVKFDAAGDCVGVVPLSEGQGPSIRDLAVDSTGVIYVTTSAIRQYSPSGTLIREFEKAETEALAVDEEDHLFAGQQASRVTADKTYSYFFVEYDSAAAGGAILRRFGYGRGFLFSGPIDLAALHTSTGDLFANPLFANPASVGSVTYLKEPPPGPVFFPEPCQVKENGNTKAALVAEVNPEGKAATVHFEYITQADYQANGNSFSGPPNSAGETAESESIGSDFSMHAAEGEAEVEPETEYRCRAVATNADGSVTGEEGIFTSLKAIEIGVTTVSDVGPEEATLSAQIDPLGIITTGYFEYVEEATYLKDIEELGPEHGFDHATKSPDPETEGEIEFGGGKGFSTGSQIVKGLKLATSYRYRIHATNLFFELKEETGVFGTAARFHTYGVTEGSLPDDRGWELVSPGLKNSADIGGPPNSRGFVESNSVQLFAASSSGEAATYTSWISFGNAEAAPASGQYLSRRTPGGWRTESISPFGYQQNLFVPPYLGFTPDLRFGAFKAGENSLAPGCPVERENFYLHEADGTVRCLTPEEPNTESKFGACFTYGGASEDGSRVFFRARFAYGDAPAGSGFSLYESHEGQIRVISVLPGQEEPAAPTPNTSFGMRSAEGCQTGQTILRHAVSVDGSRVIWTYWPGISQSSKLMMRVNGAETVPLDVKQPSGTGGGDGTFWAASKDGSVVYFTDPNKLVVGSKAEAGTEDLYRYELGREEPLTDLTKGSVAGGVKGVLGASDDGSIVYFVAKAALTPPSEENQTGEHSEAGKDNLYVYNGEEGKTTFIARVSDARDWETQPKELTSRITPDGEHLAFLAAESKELAGYDNTLAPADGSKFSGTQCGIDPLGTIDGDSNCFEAFIYDAIANSLTCASCNPTGARPQGPTLLPGWTSMSEGPRYLSDDGSKLFFETYDVLSAADENTKRDVYEFEAAGSGSCEETNPAYDPASGGCHFLISGGKSTDEARLIDASSDGRDAFFSTRSVLTGWDVNENFDIYDAREGGGFPEPSQIEPCLGEACKPPAGSPPATDSPATPNFRGQGNPAPEKAKKPKHKKKRHKTKAKKKKGQGKVKRSERTGR
jgi:DNA-binding beta-propeller fold protein YncE